jgi:glycosyltransferase involved in cell wall biosynthesis
MPSLPLKSRPSEMPKAKEWGVENLAVVVPSFNAARTIKSVLERVGQIVPPSCVLVIDDHSQDATAEIARRVGVEVIRHDRNIGYGGSQKTAMSWAGRKRFKTVAMIHGDGQYPPEAILGGLDLMDSCGLGMMLGNRIRSRSECLQSGMPLVKYLANRSLSALQNVVTGQNLGEWHSGWRLFRMSCVEQLPLERFSDGFVFDTQMILGMLALGESIGDVPVRPAYFAEASSISMSGSCDYAVKSLLEVFEWRIYPRRFRAKGMMRIEVGRES